MSERGGSDIGLASSSLLGSLRSRGALRWYPGGIIGLIWLANTAVPLFGAYPDASTRIVIVLLFALYALAFLVIAPLNWSIRQPLRPLLPTGLFALSFALWPWMGADIYLLWVYVGVAAAMSHVRFRVIVAYTAALAAATLLFAWLAGQRDDSLFYFPAFLVSITLMMASFARVIGSMNQLRATQHELARLAVEQERSRVARDLHDILGHSLTVITVKAELAGRLIETNPAGAAKEIAEVEDLARGALADVRSTVSGYRGMSIASELANARSALESGGIVADLPGSVDAVPAAYRELFGWVVREGITNVLRHSHATHCSVELGGSFVQVTDDGRGAASTDGSGLAGLRERVGAAGLTMSADSLPSGGFRLRVSS
ncbi:MAG: sensor histidine kinase [Rhodoglobus sp.]